MKNPELMQALDLDTGAMRELYDFSRVARNLPEQAWRASFRDFAPARRIQAFNRALSTFVLGNKLAKSSLRVRFGRDFLNLTTNAKRVKDIDILRAVAGIQLDDILIPPTGPVYAQFAVAGALTEIGLAESKDTQLFERGVEWTSGQINRAKTAWENR